MNSIQGMLSLLLLTLPLAFTAKHIPWFQIDNLFEKRQSTLTLPDCGQNCYTLALPDIGTCAETDTACLCEDESFMDTAQQCFQTACGSEDIGIIITLGQQTCSSLDANFFQINGITDDLVLPAGDGITRTSLFSSSSTPVVTATSTAQINTPTSTAALSSATSSSTPIDSTTLSSDRPLSTNQPLPPSIFSAATSILSYNLCHFMIFALVAAYLF
ncbi:uncharacterized protein MELLADRAFT_107523 [Melampsora larici-populina 98AG31]|uniref:CFEM domain-containing protein n=1 Tax=Melampsora larici-populina (strain 98AG31 / pathotype 3-4-7) TaxID=747676 RepID=F4RQJ5_MELLP|nr:uncharacterized protein MELLADRAFT_107523 [Melampsora larici-populina 98AG31]EGG05503.1 hypothetical protein MELLADRAFT_107523 [Melampsora larici-populina 98AG31]